MKDWTPLKRECPFRYIRTAIDIFKHRWGCVIVEIGCIRQEFNHPILQEPVDCPSKLDGHSTVHFAATGAEFYTVDINPQSIELARKVTAEYPNTRVLKMDGILFLKNFFKKIDLLFLDAWDVNLPNCAEMHLQAFKVAEKYLTENSLVMIDDCDVDFIDGKLCESQDDYGGKGRLIVPYAMNKGWQPTMKGRCVLLERSLSTIDLKKVLPFTQPPQSE